jgi:hypothetical protein
LRLKDALQAAKQMLAGTAKARRNASEAAHENAQKTPDNCHGDG